MDIKADATDQSVGFAAWTTETGVAVTITSATAGLSLWYRRGGTGAKVAISFSDLATLETAHADGGILVEEGAEHRLDLPDAAVAAGVDHVKWGGTATGITIDGGEANLIGQATTGALETTAGAAKTAAEAVQAKLPAGGANMHAAGAAVAKSPATFDWAADVTSKPTIGTAQSGEAAAAAADAVLAIQGVNGPTLAELESAGVKLTADGLDAVVVETGLNARQTLSVMAAALAGVLSGAAGTEIIVKSANGNTTRITATVDANGNRTVVVLTPPT